MPKVLNARQAGTKPAADRVYVGRCVAASEAMGQLLPHEAEVKIGESVGLTYRSNGLAGRKSRWGLYATSMVRCCAVMMTTQARCYLFLSVSRIAREQSCRR